MDARPEREVSLRCPAGGRLKRGTRRVASMGQGLARAATSPGGRSWLRAGTNFPPQVGGGSEAGSISQQKNHLASYNSVKGGGRPRLCGVQKGRHPLSTHRSGIRNSATLAAQVERQSPAAHPSSQRHCRPPLPARRRPLGNTQPPPARCAAAGGLSPPDWTCPSKPECTSVQCRPSEWQA